MTAPYSQSRYEIVEQMLRLAPQYAALGLRLERLDPDGAILRLPYSEELVAYPDTGVLAGGAIFTLMDSVCGTAVFLQLDTLRPVATLDLRLDYMKPAMSGHDVLGSARCMKVTRHVAFVRGVAFHEREDDPIAHATGTFVIRQDKGSGGLET